MRRNLKIDTGMALEYLALLDPYSTEFTFLTLNDNQDRNDKSLIREFHGTLDEQPRRAGRAKPAGRGHLRHGKSNRFKRT